MSQPGKSGVVRLSPGDIPRLIYLARVLRLCLFPVATVLLGDVVLLFVPQAREALRAFGDGSRFVSQIIALWAAYVLWMLSAWYVARLLLGRRFQPDLVGICSSPTFARKVARWLPRALAVLAALPVPVDLLYDPELRLTGALLILTGGLVLLGLVFRRHWAQSQQHAWVVQWQAQGLESIERFEQLSSGAWSFISALFIVSFGLLIALPLGMENVARPIGSPALLLFALMSWAIFGGFVLTYLPKALGYPEITWLLIVVVVLFARWNENHYIVRGTGAQNVPPQLISTVFANWLSRRPDSQAPVILVAAAGGASRAAFWTTSALGLLDDESRSHAYPLSTNMFLISGVSGGSVGAAAFVTAVDLARSTGASSASCHSVRHLGDAFTGRDDLATVIGLGLFPDMFQRFLPFPVRAWDRSRGLEEIWGHDWASVMAQCVARGASVNPWTRPLTDLYSAPATTPELPILALNSTAMNAGLPVLQANFQLSRAEVVQIFSPELATRTLTLAQAAHNSARFPYVSPAGVVQMTAPGGPAGGGSSAKLVYWDRLGDGGYVEASGAFMVTEVLRELTRARMIRDAEVPGNCVRGDPNLLQNCFITRKQIRVVILDNSPTTGTAYLCARNGKGSSSVRLGLPQNSIIPGDKAWPPVADATAPILGAFRTQGGRSVAAQLDLLGLIGGCTDRFAEIRMTMPVDGEAEPSMNWMLSGTSRKFMYQVLSKPDESQGDAYVQLSQNLARIRTWFGPVTSGPLARPSQGSLQPSSTQGWCRLSDLIR